MKKPGNCTQRIFKPLFTIIPKKEVRETSALYRFPQMDIGGFGETRRIFGIAPSNLYPFAFGPKIKPNLVAMGICGILYYK